MIKIALNNFNAVFGQRVAGTVLPIELEEFQTKRTKDGLAPATIDVKLNIVRGMVSKTFVNDKKDGHTIQPPRQGGTGRPGAAPQLRFRVRLWG